MTKPFCCNKKTITFRFALFILMSVLNLSAAAKPLTIILDWFVNPDHAPLFVAKQQGYFKQQGLNVKLISPAEPSDAIKLVAAGKADLGISYQPEFMVAVAQGIPLVRVATLINKPLSCMLVLKSGPIKTIKDLKGKTIGYSTGGIDNITLRTMLQHHGLPLSAVKLISFHYGQTQALLAHRVDAITGQMRNFELPEMTLAGQPARAFYPEKNGVPPYDELIFVTNPKEAHDPRLKRFVIALREAVIYLKKHPKQTWRVFANNHPALNNKLNRMAWFMTVPYFDSHPGYFNKKKYQRFAEFLKQGGLIKNLPPLQHYARNTD